MNRLEESLTQGASAWRRKAGGGLALLTVAWLAGCTDTGNNAKDMGNHNPDQGTDGGTMHVQQPGCSIDDWCWMFPQPQGNTLWSVWGSSATDAWAVGDSGALLHFTGDKWQPVVSPTNNALWSVWGTSASDVWAVGDRATVLHYDGQSWTPYSIAADPNGGACSTSAQCLSGQACDTGAGVCKGTPIGSLYAVWGTGADDVWMVGGSGTVLHKSGGNLTRLHPPNMPAYNSLLHGVWGTGGSIWTIGAGGVVNKFDGTNWSTATIGDATTTILTTITGTDANNIFVGALDGALRHFSGGSWMTVSPFANNGIYGLWAQGTDVYAVGEVLYTDAAGADGTKRMGAVKKWNGTMFTDVPGALPVTLFGVWGTAANNLFMVGASGTVVRYDGSAFTSSSPIDALTGVSGPIVGVTGSANNNLTAVGDWGATMQWNGTAWQQVANSIYIRFTNVAGTSDNLWATAIDATNNLNLPVLYQFGGGKWNSVTTPANRPLRGIWISGADGMVAGDNDSLLSRTGSTWTPRNVVGAGGTTLRGVWGADPSNVWIVGGGDETNSAINQAKYPGKILRFNGASAVPVYNTPGGSTLWAVWGTDATHVWAVGDAGVIVAWDGSTWAMQPSGTMFALNGIWGTSATDIYVAGAGGTVLHYDGTKWSRKETGTGVNLLNVFGVGNDVYVSGFSGAILHYTKQ